MCNIQHEGFRFSANIRFEWKSVIRVRCILKGPADGAYIPPCNPHKVTTNMAERAAAHKTKEEM